MTFIETISRTAKTGENFAQHLANEFDVPCTTDERQDVGACHGNIFPPHLAHFVKNGFNRSKDGWISSSVFDKLYYSKYADGSEAVTKELEGKPVEVLYGKLIKQKYKPTRIIDLHELDANLTDVKEIYYHKISMCLVVVVGNERIGIRSVSLMKPLQKLR